MILLSQTFKENRVFCNDEYCSGYRSLEGGQARYRLNHTDLRVKDEKR